MNPSVNHTNVAETEDSITRMRVIGAEIELGLLHPDGASPSEPSVQAFMNAYYNHALRIGIYPKLDREACQYQVEAHIAPSVGYVKTRNALNGILTALAAASQDTGLITAVFSCYPTESDFKMTDHPKVQTAVDLMLEVNGLFPEYAQRLADAQARFHVDPATCHHVNMFRNQGCHIHIDLAGRSEALGLAHVLHHPQERDRDRQFGGAQGLSRSSTVPAMRNCSTRANTSAPRPSPGAISNSRSARI